MPTILTQWIDPGDLLVAQASEEPASNGFEVFASRIQCLAQVLR